MKIDYLQNPLGIIARYKIPYGEGRYLEARIRGITEDGFNDVNWFVGEVRYARHNREIGGCQLDNIYQALKSGSAKLGVVSKKLRAWCKSMHLEISDVVLETAGVRP
jgi:hypothetical protein